MNTRLVLLLFIIAVVFVGALVGLDYRAIQGLR
jgi:hypothetical protein